jgi:hypothetical protein
MSNPKSLRRSSKLAAAVLLAFDLRSVAPKPFHPGAGGENADGQQRKELAPADGTADLNCTTEHFRVEPNRVSARRQGELGAFHRPAPRQKTANERNNRNQQEKASERRCCAQGILPFAKPNQRDEEDERGGQDRERRGEQRPNEEAGAKTDLSLSL